MKILKNCVLLVSWLLHSTVSKQRSSQSVVLSGLGVILCDPHSLGPITIPNGNHVYGSEVKMFDATNSELL